MDKAGVGILGLCVGLGAGAILGSFGAHLGYQNTLSNLVSDGTILANKQSFDLNAIGACDEAYTTLKSGSVSLRGNFGTASIDKDGRFRCEVKGHDGQSRVILYPAPRA